jgi:hypothetical protein
MFESALSGPKFNELFGLFQPGSLICKTFRADRIFAVARTDKG